MEFLRKLLKWIQGIFEKSGTKPLELVEVPLEHNVLIVDHNFQMCTKNTRICDLLY